MSIFENYLESNGNLSNVREITNGNGDSLLLVSENSIDIFSAEGDALYLASPDGYLFVTSPVNKTTFLNDDGRTLVTIGTTMNREEKYILSIDVYTGKLLGKISMPAQAAYGFYQDSIFLSSWTEDEHTQIELYNEKFEVILPQTQLDVTRGMIGNVNGGLYCFSYLDSTTNQILKLNIVDGDVQLQMQKSRYSVNHMLEGGKDYQRGMNPGSAWVIYHIESGEEVTYPGLSLEDGIENDSNIVCIGNDSLGVSKLCIYDKGTGEKQVLSLGDSLAFKSIAKLNDKVYLLYNDIITNSSGLIELDITDTGNIGYKRIVTNEVIQQNLQIDQINTNLAGSAVWQLSAGKEDEPKYGSIITSYSLYGVTFPHGSVNFIRNSIYSNDFAVQIVGGPGSGVFTNIAKADNTLANIDMIREQIRSDSTVKAAFAGSAGAVPIVSAVLKSYIEDKNTQITDIVLFSPYLGEGEGGNVSYNASEFVNADGEVEKSVFPIHIIKELEENKDLWGKLTIHIAYAEGDEYIGVDVVEEFIREASAIGIKVIVNKLDGKNHNAPYYTSIPADVLGHIKNNR